MLSIRATDISTVAAVQPFISFFYVFSFECCQSEPNNSQFTCYLCHLQWIRNNKNRLFFLLIRFSSANLHEVSMVIVLSGYMSLDVLSDLASFCNIYKNKLVNRALN